MDERLRIASLIISCGIFLFILELVRRKKLKEKYSLLWLLMGVSLTVLVLWPRFGILLKDIVGIGMLSNMVLATSILFIVILCIHFSMKISSLSEQTKVLAQEIALLKDARPRGCDRGTAQQ